MCCKSILVITDRTQEPKLETWILHTELELKNRNLAFLKKHKEIPTSFPYPTFRFSTWWLFLKRKQDSFSPNWQQCRSR